MLNAGYEYSTYVVNLFPELPQRQMKSLTFQVTDDCNLCCSYCYQQNKGHHKMPFEVAKKFIDYVFKNRTIEGSPFCDKDVRGLTLEFIGGEPLLEIDLIDQICEYFETKLNEIPYDSPWQLFHIYNILCPPPKGEGFGYSFSISS